ncbi:hypothetical protein A7U60_g2052 [Sanghuangporus baumii]|uniref:CCHC-type domain-containing protein n=1 Tax=Sanghuangporus baumii TaxID=108892 RepID=A0A9Q5I2Y8_SANBA|nr:hypothetical protein A7U60_g2052 [Sanghuangporus baumii]
MRLPNKPTIYEEFKKAAVKVDRVKRQIRDLMAKCRRKTISSTVMKPALPLLKRLVPPQQVVHPFVPPAQDRRDATGVTYGGLGQLMDVMMNQVHRTRACYKCGQVGHYIQECPRGYKAIHAIIAVFVPEDREALLEELGQVKESSFSDVDVQAVPTELEELVDSKGFPED